MSGIVQISPEELFFLGKHMRARYIDYDYVRSMKDIQQQYTLREKEILAGLVKRGLLTEDFSGDMELNEEVKSLLKPSFFGEFVSEVILLMDREKGEPEQYKFHFLEGKIVRVQLKGDQLIFQADGEGELERLKNIVIPEDYQGNPSEISLDGMEKDKLDGWMTLKNLRIRKEANVVQFVKIDGTWYCGEDDKLSRGRLIDEMKHCWKQVMREVPYGLL